MSFPKVPGTPVLKNHSSCPLAAVSPLAPSPGNIGESGVPLPVRPPGNASNGEYKFSISIDVTPEVVV